MHVGECMCMHVYACKCVCVCTKFNVCVCVFVFELKNYTDIIKNAALQGFGLMSVDLDFQMQVT